MVAITIRDVLILSLCIVVHLSYRKQRRNLLPLPPGPFRWPIVGNAFIIPLTYVHRFYKKLGDGLGSKIVYLEAIGRTIIVLNDINMARDLLEKRSALYSSRPVSPMIHDVIGSKIIFGLMPYGDEWRQHRRIFQQHLSEKHLPQIQERAIEFVRKGLLTNLISSPDKLHDHVRNTIGGLSMSMTYGLPVQRQDDPLVNFAEEVFIKVAGAGAPGKYFINVLTPLIYVPGWMPGAGFKQKGKEIRQQLDRLMEEPYQATVKQMEDGIVTPSFVADALERSTQSSDYELQAQCVKQAALQIFGETTVASVMTFFLVMLLHPDVQLKAQKELDSVVGPDRLPEFSDLPHLTFVSALLKELLRWNPIVPAGVPHMTTEEDVYMGYYIPKGCIIMANTYAMLHDEDVFPEPEKFKPERFISKDGGIREDLPDPDFIATFGFGRRICPGSHIAKSTLTIAVASVLCLFDISPALDPEGKPINVKPEFAPASITSEPLPFPCKVTPRSGKDVHVCHMFSLLAEASICLFQEGNQPTAAVTKIVTHLQDVGNPTWESSKVLHISPARVAVLDCLTFLECLGDTRFLNPTVKIAGVTREFTIPSLPATSATSTLRDFGSSRHLD
ncbi:hypothetical protein D9756_009683 [Leucocoprinus leucothites]|uniref:O-methylsterigmatocystin oxidoreductase n=1 Tax=Leucocoprinus leucothites TaxID=201217 RepID=A0A8H5CV35_9AGAR|nr:hypothetical protein D9756_009683 [Leucoagaricus leucothites]